MLNFGRADTSLFLYPATTVEIYDIIGSLKNKISFGIDGISNTMLKELRNEIAAPLSILINKSLENGRIPNQLKIAKIQPLYKSKETNLLANYRPISILTSFSKVFEKVVYKRLITFLEQKRKSVLLLQLLRNLCQILCKLLMKKIQ